MTTFCLSCLAVAAASLLTACGGSDDNSLDRGKLLEAPVEVTTLTAAQIDGFTAKSGLQAISGMARCDVKVVALNYATAGVKAGEQTNASGVLLVPGGACTGAAALIAHADGTEVYKPRTLANPQSIETLLLVAMYASQGYAVVASDYLGFAKSDYPYHPCLHADSEATTVLDAVRAARAAAPSVGARLSGKLMLTGYSQGGHAAMAAQRAAEQSNPNEFNVVGGAYLAGPYNLSGAVRAPEAIVGVQFFVPYLVTAWQKVYGNIYSNVNMAFKMPYAGYIENLLPNPTLDYTTLVTSGKLPSDAGRTPNQVSDLLFQPAFLNDARSNPGNALYLAARKNDLLGWSPRAPVLLCGGAGDPTVPTALHQQVLKADFDRRGVTNVVTVDVDSQVQAAFAPGGQAPTDPSSQAFATYYGNCHASYGPPFCYAQARAFFDALR